MLVDNEHILISIVIGQSIGIIIIIITTIFMINIFISISLSIGRARNWSK